MGARHACVLLALLAVTGPTGHRAAAFEPTELSGESPMTLALAMGAPSCELDQTLAVPVGESWMGRTWAREIGSDGKVWELEYEVAPGDTLWRIARRFQTPVAWIAIANGLSDVRRIRAGRTLRVPLGLPPIDPRLVARLPPSLRASPERLRLAAYFDRWARHYDVAPDLLMALAWVESRWHHAALSHRGAMGIGQLIPETVAFVSGSLLDDRLDPWTPDHNIRMSARFLRYLLDETDGDQEQALAAYYQGLGALRERGMLSVTRPYVTSVLAARRFFGAG